jgi:Flp pilus assembly protein TadD/predicted Zn-dependent protease with MMP-like domain
MASSPSMSRPLRSAACIALFAAACTRTEVQPAAPPSARATSAPAVTRGDGAAERALARPAPCLPAEPYSSSGVLTAEGREALAAGESERAFACAEEALRLSPRLVSALALRARSLAALGRVDDARLAFSRALAVDPGDAEALLGAAELHVRRLGPARDALEVGLEYALRGARAASARKDRTLAARLVLVAGMAENDLGRSHLALPHLERALAALPDDPDVAYERGVALFELCRFDDAQRAFERALALAPDDPWALHQLGLLAERKGDPGRAGELLSRARRLAPDEFPPEVGVDEEAFRREVRAAIAALPEEERRALETVPVEIQELPAAEDLLAVDPPLSPSILGLFRGPADDEPCTAADGPRCRAIVFYRKNLVRFARDRRELAEQVRVTLLHELGHLHGEDDDELRARGLE